MLRQGKVVAHNVLAHAEGRQLRKFRFKTIGQLASIGRRAGAASILGINIFRFFGLVDLAHHLSQQITAVGKEASCRFGLNLDLMLSKDLCRSLEVRREKTQSV